MIINAMHKMFSVPKCLVGNRGLVRRRWTAISSRAIRSGSWQDALKKVDFVSIDADDGPIGFFGCDVMTPNVICLQHVTSALIDAWLDQDREVDYISDFQPLMNLILDGMDFGWFCLGLLADGNASFLYKPGGQAFARQFLWKLLPWWDWFIKLEPRFQAAVFSLKWPQWGRAPIEYYRGVLSDRQKKAFNDALPASPEWFRKQVFESVREWGFAVSG